MATLYKYQFITSEWYKNTYNTAFEAKWDSLNQDEQERFIEISAARVKKIANRPFIDLSDLEYEQASGVQVAMGRLIDYWMEYGFDLNRISGSVSLGSFSASQTVPSDPDYVPHTVYDVLQDVNLYTPIGYFRTEDLHRIDDEDSITYGVRFKGLERVKDITIEKSTKQAGKKDQKNIDLTIPTAERMAEEMEKYAKQFIVNSHKSVIGEVTVASVEAMMNAIQSFNNAQTLTLDNGSSYSVATSTPGDVLFFLVTGAKNEEAIVTTTGNLVLLTTNNADEAGVDAINVNIQTLQNNKVEKTEAEVRYLKTDGSNYMGISYSPSNDKSVVVKENLDSVKAELKQKDTVIEGRLTAIEQAATITDVTYLYDGVLANQKLLTASFDLKTLNPAFTFEEGKKSELAIQRISTGTIVSHPITASAAITQVEFAWAEDGGKQINIDTDVNGVMTVTFGNGVNTTNYRIFEVIQKVPASTVAAGYTKAESDAKYAINNDASLTTTSKHINGADGAINELKAAVDGKATIQSVTDLTAAVNGKVAETDYENDMTQVESRLVALEAKPTALTEAQINSLINTAIAAALSNTMAVTFSDDTTDTFKLGK